MAMITEIVADHFRVHDNLSSIAGDLDTGLLSAGLAIRLIRDMAIHGSPTTGKPECDPEELAAVANGLLAHLGYLGSLIDRLNEAACQLPPQANGSVVQRGGWYQ